MKFYTSSAFKLIDKNKHTTRPLIAKAMYEGVEVVGERQVKFIISSGNSDRDNDVIPTKAWDFNNFLKNPVVLWSHNSDELPIAKCISKPTIDGNYVKATIEFPSEGLHPKADTIFEMCKQGFLNATSVGFCSDDWDYTTDERRGGNTWKPGIDFKHAELMEFSVCSVPANPDALIQLDYVAETLKEQQCINNPTTIRQRERAKRVLRFLELG
jgi:HK97 family phage prohead protease